MRTDPGGATHGRSKVVLRPHEVPRSGLVEGGGARRLQWVDVVRGLLVLAVVVGHVAYLLSWHIGDAALVPRVSALLQPVRMPALFFISGALFSSSLRRPWSEVFRRRLLPLAWVLLVWLFVEALVRATIGALPSYRPDVLLGYVVGQLWLPDDYLWFIWALVVMSVLARLVVRRWLLVVVAAALLWSASTQFPELVQLGKQADSFLRASPLFLVGAAAPSLLRTSPRRVMVALPFAAAVFVAHSAVPGIQASFPGRTAQVWLLLVALAGLVCLAALATGLVHTPLRGVLSAIGRRTLVLYLVHMPVTLLSVWVVATWFLDESARMPTVVSVVVLLLAVSLALTLSSALRWLHVGGVLGLPLWLARRLEPRGNKKGEGGRGSAGVLVDPGSRRMSGG